jgi:hypothetical protein
MASHGQTMFASAGDQGAYDGGGNSTLSVDDPASQPYVTGVGGTTLSGTVGSSPVEAVWNDGYIDGEYRAGGGGVSSYWSYQQNQILSYQADMIPLNSNSTTPPSSTMRNVPDVALNADPDSSPYAVYVGGSWNPIGGTSAAAPLWAALTALINQQRFSVSVSSLGFANPSLYQVGVGASYGSVFNDITSAANPNNNGHYYAGTGYDNATGWGSFKGSALISALSTSPVVSALSVSGQENASFSYQITATNYPSSFTVTGLPAGLTASTTGYISGKLPAIKKPPTPDVYTIPISATNPVGTRANQLTITVNPPSAPAITSVTSTAAVEGAPFSYSITATNSPTSYSTSTLPGGLSLNGATGLISGTPTSVGQTILTIGATNDGGTGTAQLTINVSLPPPPAITSVTSISAVVGVPFSYQITATNYPTSYSISSVLPAGLSFNGTTGLISGTPTAATDSSGWPVTISATNDGGTGTGATLTLTITSPLSSCPCAGGVGGNISGWVYDIDPLSTPGPVARPFAHQGVYVGSGTNVSNTDVNGCYCASGNGAMFTQLQGPYVNVSNFHGPSAHYDNGINPASSWHILSTPVSVHPYPSSSVLISSVSIPMSIGNLNPVKALPIFKALNVGAVESAGANGGEGGDITDDSEVSILDSNGHPVAGYVGNLGGFNATAVPVSTSAGTYALRLRSSAVPGGGYGYVVQQSSYLVLGGAPLSSSDPSYSLTWSSANTAPFSPVDPGDAAGGPMASEILLFYQINRQHDFFTSGSDGLFTTTYSPGVDGPGSGGSVAADIYSRPVNVLALMAPDIADPFYDPDNDNLNFGDMSDADPRDTLALDATVPHHEYTHYVVQKIWNIQNVNQAGAISEGNADYFSATSLNDSSIGSFYNYPNGPLRELDCQKSGATCFVLCPVSGAANCNTQWDGEIHDDSRFFSQSLWDIRRQLMSWDATNGQACADGLAFQSLLYFPESFEEYIDAMQQALRLGAVTACSPIISPSHSISSLITTSFLAHGLPLGAGLHSGFESALDVSTVTSVADEIYPTGDTNFYTFGAGPGLVSITMTLPAHGQPPDGYYCGYGLTLFDLSHNVVASAPASYIYCGNGGDTCSLSRTVVLNYNNPMAGQMFLQVGAINDSTVQSQSPYTLTFTYPHSGALAAGVVQASYNNDAINFSVVVTTWSQTQDYYFAYAQLRDQAQNVLNNTQTDVPGGFLGWVSSNSALGTITGQVDLQPSSLGGATCTACKTAPCTFSQCYASVGTIFLEVFGYNVSGSTVSLGLSNPINLTTNNAASLTAYNNIFNPARGQKATVKYEVQSAGHVTIKLYTLNGTLVYTLFDGDVPAGEGSVDWFGNNSAGNRVASGIYLAHMSGPGGISMTQKIIVVK